MPNMQISDIIGVTGIALAMILLVLDKAGKLRGPRLYILLGIAAVMTIFVALSNSWVIGLPQGVKILSSGLLFCAVALGYGALARWISSGTHDDAITVRLGAAVSATVTPGPRSHLISSTQLLTDDLYAFLTRRTWWTKKQFNLLYSFQLKDRVDSTIEEFRKSGIQDAVLDSTARQEFQGNLDIRLIANRLLSCADKLTRQP